MHGRNHPSPAHNPPAAAGRREVRGRARRGRDRAPGQPAAAPAAGDPGVTAEPDAPSPAAPPAPAEAAQGVGGRDADLHALIGAMPELGFTVRADGRDPVLNRRWAEYTGVATAPSLGEVWRQALHPDDIAATTRAWDTAFAARSAWSVEHRIRGADGAWRWFLTRGLPLRGDDGAVWCWFGICTDISDLMAVREEALRHSQQLEQRVAERTRALSDAAAELTAEMGRREQAQAALLHAQKLEALGMMISVVAHDFGNILTAITGSYRLMERRISDEQTLIFLRHGQDAANRAIRIIRQLTTFARKNEVQLAATDVARVIRGAQDMIAHAANRSVQCEFRMAADLWPVLMDASQFETVLLNLVANARDAMPDGGTLTIGARRAAPGELPPGLSRERDHVVVTVKDTGVGIPAATVGRVTEPFFTTKPPGEGTGLGLASAMTFARQCGGTVTIQSEVGKGTEVSLFLRQADILTSPDQAGTAPPPMPAAGPGITILVADTDETVRTVLAGLLRTQGYRVLDAASAEAAEALASREDTTIDLLVSELVLDAVTGPQLAARLRNRTPSMAVLYVTGFPGAVPLSEQPVLRKPFTEESLARAVRDCLDRVSGPAAPRLRPPALQNRLRNPVLRDAYLRWLGAQDAGGAMPPPAAFDRIAEPGDAADHSFLVEVLGTSGAEGFRVLRIGSALERDAGRSLTGVTFPLSTTQADVVALLGGTLEAAYRRCVETGAAFYDYARFADGDRTMLFERLLVPLSADGRTVTHLAGVAMTADLMPS